MTNRAHLRLTAATVLALALAATAAAAPAPSVLLDAALTERVHSLVKGALALPAGVPGQARVALQLGKLDPRLRLAPCQRIEPHLPSHGSLWGRTRIGLRCEQGEKRWQVWLPLEVKLLAPALVPRRALAAGTVLSAEHLQAAEVDWAAEAQAPLHQADTLLGRTLGRALQAGQPVRQGDLRQRHWFVAGDTVQLRARGNGFTVGAEGQALGAGVEGRTVRVRTESGRVLSGMPVGERQVELSL